VKKTPCVFVRPPTEGKKPMRVIDEVNPGCEWVLAGEGVATRKWDGTSCIVLGGRLWKRLEVRGGKEPPADWIRADPDRKVGWIPVGDGPEDQWHREAWALGKDASFFPLMEGQTYELCGPKLQGNPERFDKHILVRHGWLDYPEMPRDFDGMRDFLAPLDIEGVVFHHPDGRKAKLRKGDYGIPRKCDNNGTTT
jgi:hypothetical protein